MKLPTGAELQRAVDGAKQATEAWLRQRSGAVPSELPYPLLVDAFQRHRTVARPDVPKLQGEARDVFERELLRRLGAD